MNYILVAEGSQKFRLALARNALEAFPFKVPPDAAAMRDPYSMGSQDE